MTRFGNFTDIYENEIKDFNEILADFGISLDVYARPAGSSTTGFTTERGSFTFLDRITALFDEKKDAEYKSDSTVGETSKTTYVISTLTDRLNLNCRVLYDSIWYEVTKVNRSEKGLYQVEVQRLDD